MTGRHRSETRTSLLRRTMPDVERRRAARLSQLLDLFLRMIGSMFMRVNSKCARQRACWS
jgi:hypothetical protein